MLLGGLLALVAGLAGLALVLHQQSSALVGPLVQDSPPAPDFALTDQQGQRVQLSALRGKVVALTFLYTQCPDVCPLIASKLGQADQQLGSDRSKLALLAVSVDPAHDTPAAAQQFSSRHGLQGPNWHYLLGSREALQPVWKRYYVGTDAAELPGAAAAQASVPSPDLVNHTAIVYLIDPLGRVRVALDADFPIADFTHDVRALARG
jgi:protein SCO1/2